MPISQIFYFNHNHRLMQSSILRCVVFRQLQIKVGFLSRIMPWTSVFDPYYVWYGQPQDYLEGLQKGGWAWTLLPGSNLHAPDRRRYYQPVFLAFLKEQKNIHLFRTIYDVSYKKKNWLHTPNGQLRPRSVASKFWIERPAGLHKKLPRCSLASTVFEARNWHVLNENEIPSFRYAKPLHTFVLTVGVSRVLTIVSKNSLIFDEGRALGI